MDCLSVSPECPVEASIYGYRPNLGVSAFFVGLFALCLGVNIFLGWRYRTWTYMVAMSFACLAASIGYAGRVILHRNPFSNVGFEMQICCLTLSPAFNSAAIYLTLKHVVRKFGRECSRLRPKYYTWIFITADFLALVLQAAGGGIAATAKSNKMLTVGDNLMITGIAWQVATLLIFGAMSADYVFRRWRSPVPLSPSAQATKNGKTFQIFVAALVTIYFAIFIRCVYRVAEMANGWQNPIMRNQNLFIGADSTLVGLATLLQTFIHPGHFFPALTETKIMAEEKNISEVSIEQTTV